MKNTFLWGLLLGVKRVVDLCAAPGSWSQVSFLVPCPVAHPYQSLFIWLLDLLLALVGFEPEPVCTSKTVP